MRTEVYYKKHTIDGRALKIKKEIQNFVSQEILDLAIADVYLYTSDIKQPLCKSIFCDPVSQSITYKQFLADSQYFQWDFLIEVTYKAGVTNPVAITAKEAIETATGEALPKNETVQTARTYYFQCKQNTEQLYHQVSNYLHNKLIETATIIHKAEWKSGKRLPEIYPSIVKHSTIEAEHIALCDASDEELSALSKKRLLALTLEEMKAIQRYYKDASVQEYRRKAGLRIEPTDIELEMLAQTWSEHCKHKILNSCITYQDGEKKEEIQSLFKEYIKDTTEQLSKEKHYLRSVFHDDSGVIAFDDKHLVCFKVETHNSPSALDPYGGSITGIVGVNRDIMGTGRGARPIFNTNVLCFGMPETPKEQVPEGLLHPRQVMNGVHHGIIDGGNQSGIPVVGGAFVFDDSYLGKPLVFCGTGGILPVEIHGKPSWEKIIEPGFKAIMLGGKIGKDGIHGATFSSLALDDDSPTSAVQIGDPITQKKMSDFLMEARDANLYLGGTDNGAGGLSSSLGEMAEIAGGICVQLDACPLKYEGLAPWEIWVSESQERMSLAVPDETLNEFLNLAERRNVEAAVVGEFTNTGYIDLRFRNKPVGLLSLKFVHDGLPKMHLQAAWAEPLRTDTAVDKESFTKDLLGLLSDPCIASKEKFVRQYDHEVKAQSVVKPFCGVKADGPTDGAVLRPVYSSNKGLTVTHGIYPRYSDIDTYHMAMNAVDEAYRAHIALGGDPEYAAALDNFCWPDPVESEQTPDGSYKLAQLVRCCKGLKEACLAYGLPLISGKDSMKNDSFLGGRKISIRPTLLVSLIGIMDDVRLSCSSDFKNPGDLIYLLGNTHNELGASRYEFLTQKTFQHVPKVSLTEAKNRYKKTHSAIKDRIFESIHDLSDGGLAVALAESVIGANTAAEITLDNFDPHLSNAAVLFSESASRFLVSIKAENKGTLQNLFGFDAVFLGTVRKSQTLHITRNSQSLVHCTLADLKQAWNSLQ